MEMRTDDRDEAFALSSQLLEQNNALDEIHRDLANTNAPFPNPPELSLSCL
jgi:hypothetical protein